MSSDVLYELSRRSINISKNGGTSFVWHNSVLTVRTEKGISFFKFSYDLECLDKKIDCIETFMPNTKSSPAMGLFTEKFMKAGLRNIDMTELLLDPALWPHNEQLTNEMANIISFQWSPPGLIDNNQCLLGVLNNVGNIELFYIDTYKQTSILNLSMVIKDNIMKEISESFDYSQFELLKELAYSFETCAFCWSPNVMDNSGYITLAQKNGKVLLWLIRMEGLISNPVLLGSIEANTDEIASIIWIPSLKQQFILIISTVFGEIIAFNCDMEQSGFRLMGKNVLWSHKDRMISTFLHYTMISDKILLLTNKHRHFIVIMIDMNCSIVSQIVINVNDHRISSITKTNDEFYLTTVNCKIYKINLNLVNNQLDVDLTLLETKDSYSSCDLCSLAFSGTNSICALGIIDRRLLCRKEPLKVEIVFTTSIKRLERSIELLLNNPTGKLTHCWDIIELIRCTTMKTKTMPSICCSQLYSEAIHNMYKLKIYMILAILYDKLKKLARINTSVSFPEKSIKFIKENIMLKNAIGLLKSIHSISTTNDLSFFQKECYVGAKNYLNYYATKKKRDPSEYIDSNIINDVYSEIENTCYCCDEKLEGFSCINGHANMFCSLTFTPIQDDEYLICRCCKCTVRSELFNVKPLCLFCDLDLYKSII